MRDRHEKDTVSTHEEPGIVESFLKRSGRPIAVFCISFCIVLGLAFGVWKMLESRYIAPVDANDTETVIIDIPLGSSITKIANVLKNNGIIRDTMVFKLYVDFSDSASKVQAGTYELNPSMTMGEIVEILCSGEVSLTTTKFTLKEGQTVEDLAKVLMEKGLIEDKEMFLNSMASAQKYKPYYFISDVLNSYEKEEDNERIYNMEGYLFPSTYIVFSNATEDEIINKLLTQFSVVMTDEYLLRAEELGMTVDEVITLASMIEKEARTADMAKVSAVFHNRLKQNMRLMSDPTIMYILGISKYGLSAEEVNTDTPYNTYMYDGLPEGPICNPGEAAIKAALYPDETFIEEQYLYFCSANPATGELVFNKTYEEHQKDVELYRPIWDAYNKQNQ